MVVRVHIVAPEGAVRLDSIPVLPDRRRPLKDGIQPGRVFLLLYQLIGQFGVPEAGEDQAQIRRSHKTGRQMGPAFFYMISQHRGRTRTVFFLQKIEHQCNCISRLCGRGHPAAWRYEFLTESADDIAVQLTVFLSLLLLPGYLCGFGQKLC
ncbi:hypothetical protein D3C80_1588670 [compost metagenome]